MKGSQFPDGGQGQTDDYALGVRGAGNIKLKLLQLFAPAWGQSWTNAAGDGQIPVGVRGSLAAIGGGLDTHLSNNAIWTAGAWRYVQAGPAVNYYQSAGLHVFRAAASGAAGAAITWSQVITISSSGVGLNSGALGFPATQIASSDPNTLDDYEEGSYTPTLTSSAGTVNSTTGCTGWYRKIGSLTKADARGQFTNIGSGVNAACLSLPFTASQYAAGAGVETAVLGCALTCNVPAVGYTQMFMNKYDATTAVVVNWQVAGGISYFT